MTKDSTGTNQCSSRCRVGLSASGRRYTRRCVARHADKLIGQLLGAVGKLPWIFTGARPLPYAWLYLTISHRIRNQLVPFFPRWTRCRLKWTNVVKMSCSRSILAPSGSASVEFNENSTDVTRLCAQDCGQGCAFAPYVGPWPTSSLTPLIWVCNPDPTPQAPSQR